MQTIREKITFVLTALAYLVFHIRTGPTTGAIVAGTIEQLLTTAPYCIGFTFVLVAIIRYMHEGKRPAWDRIARIFFTIGIFFAFYFALYEYGDRAYQQRMKKEGKPATESLYYQHDTPMEPWYLA
jgi:glucan phosphoethanolaminetransferase (alkaline phosphatase superfamily)